MSLDRAQAAEVVDRGDGLLLAPVEAAQPTGLAEIGITLTGGGGPALTGVPSIGASVDVQASSGQYVEDLRGPFENAGVSTGFGPGLNGSIFSGKGSCNQLIVGDTGGIGLTTPSYNAYYSKTYTYVPLVIGNRSPCG